MPTVQERSHMVTDKSFTTGKFAPPVSEDLNDLNRLQDVLQTFRQIRDQFPASYIVCLLAVAKEPGMGVSHYANKLGMIQAVVSRILLELGQRTRTGGPGMELLDSVRDPNDYRVYRYYLTAKGKALVNSVLKLNRPK